MMVPPRLADRLLVVARRDFVQVMDNQPELLKDERVTVVPIPLLGRWMDFAELRAVDLAAGEVLIRDSHTSGFVSAQHALESAGREKSRLLLAVCRLLGATALRSRESESTENSSELGNQLTVAATSRYTGRERTDEAAEQGRDLSLKMAANVRRKLRTEIETQGRWTGSDPDIAAAEAAVEGMRESLVAEIRTMIDQRVHADNATRYLGVTVDFFSELHRDFSLVAEVASGLKAAFGEHKLELSTRLDNTLEWTQLITKSGTFAMEVWFADPPEAPDHRGH